jgi:hypothetical protein
VLRDGREYLVGTIWPLLHGVRHGRLTYEVHDSVAMVQLQNLDVDDAGLHGRGGGGALPMSWSASTPRRSEWMATGRARLPLAEGLVLRRSRRRPGYDGYAPPAVHLAEGLRMRVPGQSGSIRVM